MGAKTRCNPSYQYAYIIVSTLLVTNVLCAINVRAQELNIGTGSNEIYDSDEMLLHHEPQQQPPPPLPPQQHQLLQLTDLAGGEIVGERTLRLADSPYLLRTDLEVAVGAKLIVEPGVVVHVAPMVGITVFGALLATGTSEHQITFTTQSNSGYPEVKSIQPKDVGARLVDGPSPLAGRLQLYHLGQWRSVCTNSRNWTIPDYETVCRQMGYQGGRFWNWMERIPGFAPRLQYEEPSCGGRESSLMHCSWAGRQLGAGSCEYHSDIGVQCLAQREQASAHWRGLRFQYAPAEHRLADDNTVYESVSLSELRYVNVLLAGSGRGRAATAAIDVLGTPPVMRHVTVDQSAYTGINITRPEAAFRLHDVTVMRSRGIGVFVNSSYGLAHLDGCRVSGNGHDGIRYVGHDLRGDERRDRSSIQDFCTLPTTAGQTYPIQVSLVQSQYAGAAKDCGKYFFTRPGYVLTVSFVHFVMRTNETAELQLFDGSSATDRRLGTWMLRNSTRPQSVTSTREKIFVRFVAQPRAEVVGFLRITTGPHKAYDLNVTGTVVADNDGRGIAVDQLRSQVHVLGSSLTNNGHVAGLHVTSGAGDVNVTNSQISFNQGDGINVTYTGGNRNVSRSSIGSNAGYGIAVWLNQTTDPDRLEYLAFNQTAVVEYSEIVANLETGVLHGNYCGNGWVNITGNHFNDSKSHSLDIQTCWFASPVERTLRLQIGHNRFENDRKIGVVISPALNLVGRIEFNHFRKGKYGGLLVRNKALEEWRTLAVQLTVQNNHFIDNSGVYAASLGLSPYSDRDVQSLLFTRNFVKGNRIAEPFGPAEDGGESGEGMSGENRLSPRSRVAAPVVISSSNVDVFRNIIQNAGSKYEVGSQLSDQSQVLNVTYNWLGHSDEERIFHRLFHRKDRYDLAKIEYLPYLLHNSNPGASTIVAYSTFVAKFYADGSDRVGGEVDGQEILPTGVYTVDRDINVRPGGKLMLQPGVVLNFAPSVGMMVAGKLEARGRSPDDIFMTLKRVPVMVASVDNETTEEMATENLDAETEQVIDLNAEPTIPVRLLGGVTEHEGRLQVYLDGRWGTVCDHGWTQINAALVCHQLGLALNPRDWRLLRSELPPAGLTDDVHLSNVQCTEHDVDITVCRAERAARGEFYNSCGHEQDVGMRCYEGAWAGLRFGVLADRADLQYVTVEKAGLFDYATNTFKPAMQMDFARHNLENVRVVNNLHDGLGVIYSDIYGGSINNVKNSEFSGNRGNGISLKQLGLRVHGSIIRDNHGSGIDHDSVLSDIEQRELSGWFHMAKDFNVQESEYRPVILPRDEVERIDVDMWQVRHLLTTRIVGAESIGRTIHVRCQPGYVIGFQLLSPIQNGSTENVWIYDSQTMNQRSDVYQVRRDLSVFPVTSSSYGVTIRYESGTNAIGGVVLVMSTLAAPVQDVRNRIVRGPVPTLTVSATKIQKNVRGISATYYNRYLGDRGEHYLRKANESIRIVQCEITHNEAEAVYVHAPFWDVHVGNLSEITVHINSTVIRANGQGVRHVAKDLRSSNNLFHYVMQDTTVEANRKGGLDISLPYVWQYNENFTHSVFLGNGTWTRNMQFGVEIKGHYAVVNITGNQFVDNECADGLIGFQGMEKKLKIDQNRITGNNGRFMIEFRADSLSDILGVVPSVLAYNEIRYNRWDPSEMSMTTDMTRREQSQQRSGAYRIAPHVRRAEYSLPTRVIGFGGVQKVRIMRNLIADNRLNYDLVAGIRTARLSNYLDATDNWWGSIEPSYILSRIFDFDDWNNYAEVLYRPFLLENNVDASSSVALSERLVVDFDRLGGRLFEDLTLERRDRPYLVNADITVMPDVTLTIRPGVQMEFAPNVGILVLGTLMARGLRDGEIVMRPQDGLHANELPLQKLSIQLPAHRIEKRGVSEPLINYDSIRLCTERNCTDVNSDADADRRRTRAHHEGFLEFFNHTTLQWVPICDRRFTERNAQVVCRELGYDPLNVFVGHDKRIEFHTNSLTRIWSWVQPLECTGAETHFGDCPERLNGQLYGRRHECRWDNEYVFVSCRAPVPTMDAARQYWGGIRFANPDFERNAYAERVHDVHTHETRVGAESWLEFVRIESAGMLHAEKSPAVQTIQRNPRIRSVTIIDSAHHGLNLVSPSDAISVEHLKVERALGEGINAISLTGEGRDSSESSFSPLKALDLPYNLFSMIDICDTSKEITLEERVIVYYKYDNNPVNCVKIFKSAYRVKPIGFRLLQANLFNHSKEYGRRDAIHLFDGDIYNISSRFIGGVEAESENEKELFRTTGPILSVRLIASGAPARHGFIAEVVTLPISAIGFNRDAQHNISNSEIIDSVGAAISYTTAGEVSPILTLEGNRIVGNCRQMYGNFSTCEAAVKIDVQNMQTIHFRNNLVQNNQGGLFIRADSRGSATSLRAWIHHNLFAGNLNRASLYCEGRQSSPYQEVTIYKNYFTQNAAGYADVISLRQVVSNFSYNYVHYNRGGRIVEISGFDRVRLPIYQTTSHNGFYDNIATSWKGRATVVAGTAGQQYVDNIFYNPDNDYEMITVNRSIFEFQFWNSTVDLWKTKIDARHNYWNYNETLAVGGRIRDRADNPQLLEVDYKPFHMNNLTVLDVKCPPGWSLLIDTCYMYVGAPMTFHEARDFCRSDNASLPFIQGDATQLWQFLQRQMTHRLYPEKVWVQHLNYLEQCTSFIYYGVEVEACEERHGFICEIDPRVRIDPLSWQADIVAISVVSSLIAAIFILCLFVVCWWSKSRHRHVQRLERRNSIRQSLRSLNTIDPQGSMQRRRNYNMSRSTDTLTKSNVTDYKKMVSNGSIDSMEKSVISESSYDVYNTQKNANTSTTAAIVTGAAAHRSVSQPDSPVTPSEYNDLLSAKYQEYAAAANATAAAGSAAANNNATSTATVSRTSPRKAVVPTTSGSQTPSPPTSSRFQYGMPAALQQHQQQHPPAQTSSFELAYRNEGFRDNSTYGANTRSNSVSNYLNTTDDVPIIHQVDGPSGGGNSSEPFGDNHSDYYGNSSTLPLRNRGVSDQLSFLSELKHKLPEYEKLPTLQQQNSFLPAAPPDPSAKPTSKSGYTKQTNSNASSPRMATHEYHQPEIRRPIDVSDQHHYQPPPLPPPYNNTAVRSNPQSHSSQLPVSNASSDQRRPESYFAAMRSQRDSTMPGSIFAGGRSKHSQHSQSNDPPPDSPRCSPPMSPPSPPPPPPTHMRPKTVYVGGGDGNGNDDNNFEPLSDGRRSTYSRSKSEALLETNFDDVHDAAGTGGVSGSIPMPLSNESRSHSQPLETAM